MGGTLVGDPELAVQIDLFKAGGTEFDEMIKYFLSTAGKYAYTLPKLLQKKSK